MFWVVSSVALAFAGLLVLAYCAFRVFQAVRVLATEIERARRLLGPRRSALKDEVEVMQRMNE